MSPTTSLTSENGAARVREALVELDLECLASLHIPNERPELVLHLPPPRDDGRPGSRDGPDRARYRGAGVGFSVEPGVYLPDDVSIRSEIDVPWGPDGPEVTPAEPQDPIFRLLGD